MRLLVFPPVFGIIVLLLLESFVVKSILFDKNDPILIHYLISGLLISALTFLVFSRQSSRAYLRQLPGLSIAILAFLWLIVATSTRSNSLEWAALLGFGLLFVGFYYAVPSGFAASGVDARKFLLFFFGFIIFLSLFALIVSPVLSFELPELRFRGALISVANSCNIFMLSTIYFSWALKYRVYFSPHISRLFAGMSFVFLLMTLTRSSIIFTVLALFVLAATDGYGRLRGARFVLISAALAALLLIFALTFDQNTLEFLRLGHDNGLDVSRGNTWNEGTLRVQQSFLMGTGLLTKQTKGGTSDIDFTSTNYTSQYDAHSLFLTLIEQGGILFLAAVISLLLLPLWRYCHFYGLRYSLQQPEFLIMALIIPGMMVTGGDMVSLGNFINRLEWLFLGILSVDISRCRTSVRISSSLLNDPEL